LHASLTRAEIAAVLLTSLAIGNLLSTVAAIASTPARFEARVELLAGDGPFADDLLYRDPRATAGIAEAYARLATSRPVIEQTVDRLNLGLTAEELTPLVRTETVIGSPFFAVEVLDPDPELAASIANEIAAILSAASAGSPPGPQRLRIVDSALPPAGSSETWRLLAAAVASVIAFMTGLAIAILPRDGTRRPEEARR